MQPDLSGALFTILEKEKAEENCKKAGTEGINEKKAKAFIEVYERSSKLP